MTAFVHFILTRFNLKIWPQVQLKQGWYEHRLALFEQFCLPSIQSQSQQQFTWLILCDSTTPAEYLSRIQNLCSQSNMQVHMLDGFDIGHILAIIRAQLGQRSHLITTSLDNDDALADTFVETLQQQFRGQAFELINFPRGYRFVIRNQRLYACDMASNPFISLIERIDADGTFRSIAGCLPHSTIAARFPALTDVFTAPLWLQVLHGYNLANTHVWGRQRQPRGQLAAHFSLNYALPSEPESRWVLNAQNLRARVERAVIDGLTPAQKNRLGGWLRRGRGR